MVTRGIRNNNPGNIRKNSTQWLGLAKDQADPNFFIFTDMVYGCRALLRILSTYYNQRNCTTIRSIINRFAPSVENNTEAYIEHVAFQCKVLPDTKINLSKDIHLQLAKAIAKHENGSDTKLISDLVWEKAYAML